MQTIAVGTSSMPMLGLAYGKSTCQMSPKRCMRRLKLATAIWTARQITAMKLKSGRALSAPLTTDCAPVRNFGLRLNVNTFHRRDVAAACRKSLEDLGLDYFDLYLVHFPIALKYVDFADRYPPEFLIPQPKRRRCSVTLYPEETWPMEELVDQGLARQIGVCNYNSGLLHDLMSYARIKPAMLQIESTHT